MKQQNGACSFGSNVDLGCFNGSRGFDQVIRRSATGTGEGSKTDNAAGVRCFTGASMLFSFLGVGGAGVC